MNAKYVFIVSVFIILSLCVSIPVYAEFPKACKKDVPAKKCADGTYGKVYAIFIAGSNIRFGEGIIKNSARKKDTSFAYDTLVGMGIPNLITISSSPESDPDRDFLKRQLSEVTKESRECDTLVYIYTGHGSDQTLSISGDEDTDTYTIRKLANEFKGTKVFLFQSCESGTFGKNIIRSSYTSKDPEQNTPKNTLILSSTKGDESYCRPFLSQSFIQKIFTGLKNSCDFVSAYIGASGEGSIYSTLSPKDSKITCKCQCK